MNEGPAGLYLHVPFCARVCPYCDFAVRTGDRARRRRYVDHLLAEIDLYAGYPLQFDTVYFGGGTPSSLEAGDLMRIVERLRERLRLAQDTRVFLEANPDDVSRDTATAWKRLGLDTLSLGVQSFDGESLAFLGRSHGPADARRAIAIAREAGFRTVSIDLIYGLPGQGEQDWRRELDRAVDNPVDHISCYQLTIHPRTRFGLLEKRRKLAQLPGEQQAALFRLTHNHLAAAGFEGYEVSQFCKGAEHRSRHNVKYWDHTPYLGLGPSAHSFHDRRRWWNLRRTDPWQEQVAAGGRPVEGSEDLDGRALALESLMTGLRTRAGADVSRIAAFCGSDLLARNAALVRRLGDQGLLTAEQGRLVPTLDGMAVADSLAASFEL